MTVQAVGTKTVAPAGFVALHPPRRLVPQPGIGRPQIGIVAAMRPEQNHRLGARGVAELDELKSLEIVGEIDNPALEAVRRFWWRAFDRVCGCFVSLRLLLFDRINGPERHTPADLQREIDHEAASQSPSSDR
jgi:hypothetical protein